MKHFHPKRPQPPALGIDVGRVIIAPIGDDGSSDTQFLGVPREEALAVPPAPGSFETIAELWVRFEHRVWLVSKAGPKIQQMTLLWMQHHGFHRATGLPEKHVRFCRERAEKREHAVKVGLTHFIDDRIDVLQNLVGVVPRLYLFGYQGGNVPKWATHVPDWGAVRREILDGSANVARALR